jgi:hypothetical protein
MLQPFLPRFSPMTETAYQHILNRLPQAVSALVERTCLGGGFGSTAAFLAKRPPCRAER